MLLDLTGVTQQKTMINSVPCRALEVIDDSIGCFGLMNGIREGSRDHRRRSILFGLCSLLLLNRSKNDWRVKQNTWDPLKS